MRVNGDFVQLARQQVALGEMLDDQRMNRTGFGRQRRAQRDRVARRHDSRSGMPTAAIRRRGAGCTRATVALTRAPPLRPRQTLRRGCRPRDRCPLRDRQRRQHAHDLFIRTIHQQPALRGPRRRSASRPTLSCSPRIRPTPRTSTIAGCFSASARSRRSKCAPTVVHVIEQALVHQLFEEKDGRAAGEQVAAVGAAVIAGRDR